MFLAIPVFDRASYGLSEYFQLAVHDLDRAGDEHITVGLIGDPARSGRIHQGLRSSELRRRDERDSRYYISRIYRRGMVDHHRLGEMDVALRTFDLSDDDIPCIAFLPETGTRPVGVFRILASWYESPASINTLDRCLRDWLGSGEVKQIATTSCLDSVDIRKQLAPLLDNLALAIDRRLTRETGRRSSPKPRMVESFPTPAGAKWREVLARVGDLHIVIEAKRRQRAFTFEAAGFEEQRKGGVPDGIWVLLRVLAMRGGEIPCGCMDLDRKTRTNLKQYVSELRRRLRALIPRIEGDPVPYIRDERCYRVAFEIASQEGLRLPTPAGTKWPNVTIGLTKGDSIRISFPATERFGSPTYEEGVHRLDAAEREVDREGVYSLRLLGLTDEHGQLNPRGVVLLELLRGNGAVRRPADDPAMLGLCEVLTKLMDGIEGFPFEFAPWDQKWVAMFQTSCDLP